MKLPIQIETPTYVCELPSTGQSIEYRPYVVREEKLLLLANETEDPTQIAMTLKNVLDTCTFQKLDISQLPIFDIEYIYLMIRAKSRGEELNLNLKCTNVVEGEECGANTKVVFNLISDVKIKRDEKHHNKIMIDDKVGVVMRYPTFLSMISENKKEEKSNIDDAFIQVAKCIDTIFDEEQEVYTSDYSMQEVQEFIENLTEGQFQKISQFLETMPKVVGYISFKCSKCGFKHKNIEITGIQDFLN